MTDIEYKIIYKKKSNDKTDLLKDTSVDKKKYKYKKIQMGGREIVTNTPNSQITATTPNKPQITTIKPQSDLINKASGLIGQIQGIMTGESINKESLTQFDTLYREIINATKPTSGGYIIPLGETEGKNQLEKNKNVLINLSTQINKFIDDININIRKIFEDNSMNIDTLYDRFVNLNEDINGAVRVYVKVKPSDVSKEGITVDYTKKSITVPKCGTEDGNTGTKKL